MLLQFRKTHNALQLLVFFLMLLFFYQPCLGLQNCKSVFLILKIPIWRIKAVILTFSVVWIHVRIDTKVGISISKRHMTTKSDKQVHLEELTQIRWIRQVLVALHVKITWQTKNITTRLPMSTKLGRTVTYLVGLLPIKSHDPLTIVSSKVTVVPFKFGWPLFD